MRYLKKIQCFLIALAFILAIIPFKVYADNSNSKFKIVGWQDGAFQNAVISVKVNGIKLSEYNSETYSSTSKVNGAEVSASSNAVVEITLEEGYVLSQQFQNNAYLTLNNAKTNVKNIANSQNTTSITMPSEDLLENNQELYLYFEISRNVSADSVKYINNVTLNVGSLDCGTKITHPQSPEPNASVPDGKGYRIVKNSATWLMKEGEDNYINAEPFVAKGGNNYIFSVELEDRGIYFFDNINENNVTVKNGKLLRADMSEDNVIRLIVSVTAEHIAGKPTKTNIIAPTCTETGSHDEIVKCSGCNETLSKRLSITDPATGHNWGEWMVTEEPTINEKGKKECICKNDPSHVQTQTIPCLDSCVIKFNNNGHGITPKSQQIKAGDTAAKPKNMRANGYKFCGWYTDHKCTKPFDFKTPITKNITLYAKWIPVISETKFFKTGDRFNVIPWCAMLGLSLTTIAFLEIRRKYCRTYKKIK